MPAEDAALTPAFYAPSFVPAPPIGSADSVSDHGWSDPPSSRHVELEQLGDRIAELSARIQAATYELLVLIREFDARTGWSGCTSCGQWLSWRTGLAPGAAREHVRVARALDNLPKLSDAMRRGTVSYSKVRAVTRVATPETEQALLDVALCGTAAHVEQIVRGWRRVDRTAEHAEDRRRYERRSLRTWVDDDGMVVVRGRLTPEVGAVLRRALEAACDQARIRPASGASADSASDAGGDAVSDIGADCGADAAAEELAAVEMLHGNATALGNLVLLCRRHHRTVHEGGFRVTVDAAGEVQFVRPDGRPLAAAPRAPLWTGAPLAPVTARLGQEGATIGPHTATPAWRGERVDIGWAVGVLWRPRPDADVNSA